MRTLRPVLRPVATLGLSLGVALLAAACGGGGAKDFSNPSLVSMTTATVPAGATGQPYAAQLTANFPHPPGQFVVSAGRLPPGVELDNLTGAISGFPRQLGRFNFDVSARDGVDPTLPPDRDTTFSEAVRSFALDVTLGTPNILPQTMPAAQYRRSFLYHIDAAGGTPPYTFTLVGGTLPAGIELAQDGRLGSFPTQANVATGVPFEFDVKVTDAQNLSDTAHFALNVVVLPLIILTSNIPEAAQGFPYDTQLTLAATGGGQPITWSQVPPTGTEVDLATIGMEITPDGHVRNSISYPGPTTLGTHTFTIQVTDEAQQIATRQYTLKVNPGPVLTGISPGRASQSGPYNVTGANFQPGAVLVFKPGPTEVTITPIFVGPTQLRFNNPPTAPGGGSVAVRVVNPDTGAYTKPGAYTFPAATVSFGTKGFVSSNVSSMGLDCADINGDGWADVVHCGASSMQSYPGGSISTSPGLILHRNLATTPVTFSSVTLDAANFYDCKFADVNSDGKLDVVALGQTQVKVFLNGMSPNPLGTFGPAIASTHASGFSYPSQMTMGRLNADAVLDLAFSVAYNGGGSTQGRCYTMVGNGAGAFTLVGSATSGIGSSPNYTYGVPSLCAADTDGDGRDEVCAGLGSGYVNYSSSPAFHYNQVGTDGSFSTWSRRGTLTSPYYGGEATGIAAGDFLGTGAPAVIVPIGGFYYYALANSLWMFSGSNLSTGVALTAPSGLPTAVGTLDADFDSKLDWAISFKSTTVEVYRGSTQKSTVTLDVSAGSPGVSSPVTGRIASGDIDNDGRPDLLVATSNWICNAFQYIYGYYTAQVVAGDGGNKGFAFYLNTSN